MGQDINLIVSADTSGAISALERVNKAMSGMERVSTSSMDKISSTLGNLGKAMAGAFALDKIKDFTVNTIETTASLQAMESQFKQVFKGAETTQALASIGTLSSEVGVQTDRLTASFSKFGAQTKGAGMDAVSALSATEKATKLAADGSAFYDMSLEQTTAMLSSFMKGNFEAGDSIGVFTSANQMGEQSLKTYGVSWDKLTEAQKENLLLDKVSSVYELNGAMGQASREQDNWTNSVANLKATWDNFVAGDFGTFLLDLANNGVQFLTDKIKALDDANLSVKGTMESIGKVLQDNKTAFQLGAIAVGTLTVALIAYNIQSVLAKINSIAETVALTAMYIVEGIATIATSALAIATAFLTSPITLAILAIGALIAVGVLMYKNWDTITAKAGEFGKAVSTKFEALKSSVSSIFDGIKNTISDKINSAKNAVKSAIDAIKGFFNFSWKLPDLKMPHFSATGNFSLNPLSVPKIGVNWYAKGGMFDSPSVIGVGEAGKEAVLPLTNAKAMGDIAGAIIGAMPDSSNYRSGQVITPPAVTINFTGNIREEADVKKIAREMSEQLYKLQTRDARGRGMVTARI